LQVDRCGTGIFYFYPFYSRQSHRRTGVCHDFGDHDTVTGLCLGRKPARQYPGHQEEDVFHAAKEIPHLRLSMGFSTYGSVFLAFPERAFIFAPMQNVKHTKRSYKHS
jgi:hypothetical protein